MHAIRIEFALLQEQILTLSLIKETFPKSVHCDDNVGPTLDSNLRVQDSLVPENTTLVEHVFRMRS